MSKPLKFTPSPSMIVALIALFVALGGTAVALDGSNIVFSDDIVNGEVYSGDVRNDTLAGGGLAAVDLQAGSVGEAELQAASVGTEEVRNDTAAGGGLGASDLRPGSVGPSEVIDNSLTGADINESTLSGTGGTAIRIDSQLPLTPYPGSPVTVLQSKGLTLSMRCFRDYPDPLVPVVASLWATGSAGSVVNFSGIRDDAPNEPRLYLSGASLSATPSFMTDVRSTARTTFGLNYVHGVYRSAQSTVSFEANAVASDDSGGACQLHGTATPV